MSTLQFHYLQIGHCRHLEVVAASGGRFKRVDFPSFCALIIHPVEGVWLFDTGYSEHFFTATQSFPERLDRLALPVELPEEQGLLPQLDKLGLSAGDIRGVIVSHYHGDHVAGLRDFPNARFLAGAQASSEQHHLASHPFAASCQGKLPKLLPDDYWQRLIEIETFREQPLPRYLRPFDSGFDLLGDGSLLAVPLPGHSAGQMGLWVANAGGRGVLLVADACWLLDACRERRLPLPLTNLLTHEVRQYQDTFFKLSTLINREPGLQVLPSHCTASGRRYIDESA
jgi:glyoxylase-like metal-dependent hydrolase (beta-lactamase superfamily II)